MRERLTATGPVLIAGMHRSGTSVITGVLKAAGLNLGDPSRLMPGKEDNADGFFEHLDFVAINDALLATFGGGWDCPPQFPSGWTGAEAVRALSAQASNLIERDFSASHQPWGWKDPRNSLTLPFWLSLCPRLRVIVCLRNPFAAARSLAERGTSSMQFGLKLWKTYHERLKREMARVPHIVTHYDSFLTDPVAELGRVASFIGLGADEQTLGNAAGRVRRRDRSALPDDYVPLKRLADPQLLALYDHFRAQAGPTYESLGECKSHPPQTSGRVFAESDATDDALLELAALRQQFAIEALRSDELERWLSAYFAAQIAAATQSSPLAWNSVIDFTRDGNARRHMLHGWSVSEPEGTWTDGNGASLVLPRFQDTGFAKAVLKLHASPFLRAGLGGQEVEVRVEGEAVAHWTITGPGVHTARFDAAVARRDHWIVELVMPHAKAPAELGLSADRRRLGVLVKSIAVSCNP